ncbi:DUF4307 domain-containing protein [Actinomadura sp. HBU206391]|uniref:DUF4307 domain-containing protein n=1 Tax=Actinomadura sp. HBU206391 TaxID=2731692 RepID=UPI00164FAD9D|nr:DUF4307 domain-containing protein [Actinomadura sp. HBU206391]MBC6457563.1 DUF4307 domain-containing protein [Actinomadura sp. HBU206391]
MAMSDTEARTPARRRFSPGLLIIGLVAAVAAFGWAYVMAHVNQTPGIVAQTVTFRVLSDSRVEINFSVTKPRDSEVRCVISAVDTDFAEVGRAEILVPAGTERLSAERQLQTSSHATAAQVKDCVAL